jgi:hypothetical protein
MKAVKRPTMKEATRFAERAQSISLRVIGEWERFELMEGGRPVFSWSEDDVPIDGSELAAWFAFRMRPVLHGLASAVGARNLPENFRRPNIKGRVILEVAATLAMRRDAPPSKAYILTIKERVEARLIALKKTSRCPESMTTTVTERYVRQVLTNASRDQLP